MAYTITSDNDKGGQTLRLETAPAALERVKQLEKEKAAKVKITDRAGAPLTEADLEKLSGKENIL